MTYKYNPTLRDLRDAYFVAHGASSDSLLIGVLSAHLPADTIERLYVQALDVVREDLEALDISA
jgi:hypothetical protein